MKVKTLTSDDVQVDWPQHRGVGGLGLRATCAATDAVSAGHALGAIGAWLPGLDSGRDPGSLVESVRADRFPYAEVLAHYQRVGRTNADRRLVSRLSYLNDLLHQPALAADTRLWPLPHWLPSTTDQTTGNYDSYLVSNLLESMTFLTDVGAGQPMAEVERATDDGIDTLIAALVADLAMIEADALRLHGPTREQRRRTQACLLALSKLGGLAPKWADGPGTGTPPVSADVVDPGQLVETILMLAQRVRCRLSRRCRQVVTLSLMPTTRLHDEQMFVRSIQIFETLYRQVYRCLVRASAFMQVMDVDRACAELADATARISLAPVLYRVVTTMPKDSFAIIRQFTDGRSAIQSRSYRQIDLVCAPRQPSPVADRLPAVEVTSPTLQETFVAIRGRIDPAAADRLETQMRAFDTAWRAMKRTHWGITLKIIGRVPGTGGTRGADYLKYAADLPLFPMLAGAR